MKTLIVTLLFAMATAFSQEQQQPQQPQRDRKQGAARRASMKKLQTDLDQAASRAKFTAEQRKQWDEARQTLREQARQRGGGRKRTDTTDTATNASSAREALKTLRGLTSSEAFQPEDRELLKKDFDALRKSGGRNRQGAKAGRKSAA